jgi:hypothetical protein
MGELVAFFVGLVTDNLGTLASDRPGGSWPA